MGEFFRFFLASRLPPQSGWRSLSSPPLFSTPLLTIPFFPPRLPSSLLSNSLLHIPNASSPQLSPADVCTLSRSHVHHLLLRSSLGTRLYGYVTKGKAFAQSSIRAEPVLSLQARSFKNNVEDESTVLCELSEPVFA